MIRENREEYIQKLVGKYGDVWVLRDLDCFPEKLSSLCMLSETHFIMAEKLFQQTLDNDGPFVSFQNEEDALKTAIEIYQKILKKKVPSSLYLKLGQCVMNRKDENN